MKLRCLRPGDLIALVTPASPIERERILTTIDILEGAGYRCLLGRHALDADGFLAGRDEDRARDLQDAFADPDVAAVMCTRGGYGCARLFPHLDLDAIVASRKMLLGFSDVTTLHVALNRRGMPTVHAPMALTLHYEREPWVIESFLRVLGGDLRAPENAPPGYPAVGGIAEGLMAGGCLCLLTDSIGTPNALDAEGKLLVIEDVDEMPHRIDAMLTHLLNSGIAQSCAGFVVGEMTRTDEKGDSAIGARPWRQIVMERLGPLNKPMILDYPLGHAKSMLTLPLGIRARLDADAGTLTFLEPLCE